jgi:hypothetical protein
VAGLEASAEGKGLYERAGYESVGDITFDTRPWGGDRIDVHTVMLRQPKKAEATGSNESA